MTGTAELIDGALDKKSYPLNGKLAALNVLSDLNHEAANALRTQSRRMSLLKRFKGGSSLP